MFIVCFGCLADLLIRCLWVFVVCFACDWIVLLYLLIYGVCGLVLWISLRWLWLARFAAVCWLRLLFSGWLLWGLGLCCD